MNTHPYIAQRRASSYIWENQHLYYDHIFELLKDRPVYVMKHSRDTTVPDGHLAESTRMLLIMLHKLGVRP